ncbi:tripartite tricarboxylate transporter substrate-binding protein [Enterovirga rhinocerotis]|uniref:Tripartite-type tricarboxylate transporter receptor subunit TctC n=1 Tax=Enterovirga rhinocerotis TaxID=1339210 RepID=A0A4R7BK47_9HYPH|nr:tripartite tricarboxylate transporter substrate-binding protein [Enterovirga rhinocerotis]TDR85403.1 tripartite-type tricarboxylate transporter receptor subunit TctC [Enterovirga rhinocerotis]
MVRKLVIMAAAIGVALAGTAAAQDFPTRPITLVMPYSAGGPGDTLTRLVAQGMSTALGQQVIVENTAGAGGTIGSQKVAQSPPDGYTLLMIHVSAATNPALYPKLKYDQLKDFQPIGIVVDLPSVFVAKKDFAPKTFADLIDYVKANKDKVTYAHAGIGSASHLCGLLFQKATGTKVTSVAYRGTGPAMNDLMAGQVDMMCDQTVNVIGNVEAGSIKGYAVTSDKPVPTLPKLPVAAENGLPGFKLTIWYGIWAPKGLPQPVLDKLTKAVHAALADKTIRERMAQLGAEAASPERATPEALQAHLQAETDKWGPIIREAGVTAGQ